MVPERGHAHGSGERIVDREAIESRRAARRMIASVEQENPAAHARRYAVKVEAELPEIRDGILVLMDKNLIPSASWGEPEALCFKMKDDYYRCLAEFATGDARSKPGE